VHKAIPLVGNQPHQLCGLKPATGRKRMEERGTVGMARLGPTRWRRRQKGRWSPPA
jgi:hypothetical protein